MLTLEPLRTDQYRQVDEWEWGPKPDADWERYEREMNAPQWAHFAIYSGAEFVGCISLEQTSRNIMEFHVVTGRHKVHTQALAIILLDTAAYLFANGFLALTAHIPRSRRAAAVLALRCGMWEYGHTPSIRYFILTKRSYDNGRTKAEGH